MDIPHPSDSGDDFHELMRRIGEGSEDAAWEVVERYGETIRRAVRRALNQRLRSKFDSLDFVQIVWSSFFRARIRFARFDRPEELVAFLVTMAHNKVGMEVRRRLSTKKFNLNREDSLENSGDTTWKQIPDRQPMPIDVAIARERWNYLLQDQPEHYRKIIQLRIQGHTCQAIAATLGLDESTVRRFLRRLFAERVA
jgi:RNA polymerase sigma factor (sigma-70 family)